MTLSAVMDVAVRTQSRVTAGKCAHIAVVHFTPPARTNRGLTVKRNNSNCIFDLVRARLTVLPSFESTTFWQIQK